MLILNLLLFTVESLQISTIPSTGSPPEKSAGSSAAYDIETNTIITIGGERMSDSRSTSDVNMFNLTTRKWYSPKIISNFIPGGLRRHRIYLRKDRKIIVFGLFKELLIFDLEDFSWSTQILSGDQIGAISSFAISSFILDHIEYVAIFGGSTKYSYSNSLFLINIQTFTSRKLPNNGKSPSPRSDPTLVYHEKSLYMYGYSTHDFIKGLETGSELFKYNLSTFTWELVSTEGPSPGARNSHYSYFFNNNIFIIYGMRPESLLFNPTVYKLNLETMTWSFVKQTRIDYRVMSADVLVGQKVYFLYGPTTNSVVSIDLDSDHLELEEVSSHWESPAARLFHAGWISNENLYVFGGADAVEDGNQDFFNDLWIFNLEYEDWTLVDGLGSVPSPRSNFASVQNGDYFFIFGGKGYDGYLDDLFYLHIPSQKWFKLEGTQSEWPSARASSCLAFSQKGLYLAGGRFKDSGYNDLWFYDFASNTFELQEIQLNWYLEPSNVYETLIDPVCWMSQDNFSSTLNIAGGYDISLQPNLYLFQVTFNTTVFLNATLIGNQSDQAIIGAETAKFFTGDSLFRVGGSIYSWVVFQNFFILDLKSLKYKILQTKSELGLFGHSAFHYKKFIYLFGGGGSTELYKSELDIKKNLIKIDSIEGLGCSLGTFGNDCEFCPPGTFGANGKCLDCPRGKFNDKKGSSGEAQCKPCPFGYYSNIQGARYCLQCPSGYECPVGATHPVKPFLISLNDSYQPDDFQYKTRFISKVTQNIWYFAGGFFLVFIVVCFFSARFWIFLRAIDIFSSNHENGLNVPVVYRKTSFGGFFSIVLIMISGITVILSFLTFYLDNVSELKSLIPSISLETEVISSKLSIKSIFFIYGDDCVEIPNSKLCSSRIKISEEGIFYESRVLKCVLLNQNCIISAEYSNFKLTLQNSFIIFSLEEQNSYASAISVNLTTSSSIPEEISGLHTVIQSGSREKLLKGNKPSELFYKFTPSVFKSESSEWPSEETGFHVSFNQNPTIGSLASEENLDIQKHVKVKVSISLSENAMLTSRVVNQTGLIFVGSLLGSIFGLMGSVAVFMKVVEEFSEKYERRKKNRERMEKQMENRERIKEEIYPQYVVTKSSKVSPQKYKIRDTFAAEKEFMDAIVN